MYVRNLEWSNLTISYELAQSTINWVTVSYYHCPFKWDKGSRIKQTKDFLTICPSVKPISERITFLQMMTIQAQLSYPRMQRQLVKRTHSRDACLYFSRSSSILRSFILHFNFKWVKVLTKQQRDAQQDGKDGPLSQGDPYTPWPGRTLAGMSAITQVNSQDFGCGLACSVLYSDRNGVFLNFSIFPIGQAGGRIFKKIKRLHFDWLISGGELCTSVYSHLEIPL